MILVAQAVALTLLGCSSSSPTSGWDTDAGAPLFPASRAPSIAAAAQTLAKADATLASRLAPRASTFERTDDALSSAGWRAAAKRAAFDLGALAPAHVDEPGLIGIGRSERFQLKVTHEGMRHAAAALQDGQVIYEDVAPSTDAIVASDGERAEWLYVLRDASAPSELTWRIEAGAGLPTTKWEPSGALVFVDAKGTGQLRIPRPYVVDAKGVRREAQLAWDGKRARVSWEREGLSWPVLVDPAVESVVWEQVAGPPLEPGPGAFPAVYDTARSRLVLVRTGGVYSSDRGTYEWDGTSWRLAATDGPQSISALAYDSNRGRTVTFSAGTSATAGETWEWQGTSWSKFSVPGPTTRSGYSLAYDEQSKRTILFGGMLVPSTYLGETWSWDGSTWSDVTSAGPTTRAYSSMAYDAGRGRIVLFGGQDGSGMLGDTWERGSAGWQAMSSTGPAKRVSASLTYESSRGTTVLFGGAGGTQFADTWEWNGVSWAQTATTGPSGRHAAALVYMPTAAKTILTGGSNSNVALDDMWGWDGSSWAAIRPDTAPGLWGGGIAWNAATGRSVLTTGNATYEWDGTAWRLQAYRSAGKEANRTTYDSKRARVVTSSGNHLFAWNGSDWIDLGGGFSAPPYHAIAYDSVRDRVVLFGGANGSSVSSDTWEYDGSTWTLKATTGPSPRGHMGLAFDERRALTVLYGGSTGGAFFADTWEWDGTTWRNANASQPGGKLGSLIYDSRRAKTILFGGTETWEWDGVIWKRVATAGPPNRNEGIAFTYDAARRRGVLYGPPANASNYADTWEYHARGGACTTGAECDTSFCVDGVCCESSACGSCQACDTPTLPGVCTTLTNTQDDSCNGQKFCGPTGNCGVVDASTCSKNADCASGFCVDGFCCNTACNGGCDVCNGLDLGLPGAGNGICFVRAKGYAGAPSCTPTLCDGAAGACPTKCAVDADCVAGHFCAADATCQPQHAQGAACDLAKDCKSGSCRECATGFCADGVCCDTACPGLCQACSATLKGSGADGTCGPIDTGKDPENECATDPAATCQKDGTCDGAGACRLYLPGSSCGVDSCTAGTGTKLACDGVGICKTTAAACAPYVCLDSACSASCANDVDCAANARCSASKCVFKGRNGSACSAASECDSGICVDGFCCDRACQGQCEACDITGLEGTCAAVNGAPHGKREACGGDVGCAGKCDGATPTACNYGLGTECAASCTAASATLSACDAKGKCVAKAAQGCNGYACASDGHCKTACTGQGDCAEKYACKAGVCEPSTTHCSEDGLSQVSEADGTTVPCAPYVCAAGACRANCASTADCQTGSRCNADAICVPIDGESASSAGCAVSSTEETRSSASWIGWLAAAGMVGRVRARRKAA